MLEQVLPRLQERFELHVYSRSGAGPGGSRHPALTRSATERLYRATRLGRKVLDTLFLDPIHLEWTSHLLLAMPTLQRGRYDVIWHETGLWGGLLLAGLRRATGVRLLDIGHSSHLGWEVPFARRRPDIYVAFNQPFAERIGAAVPGLRVEVVPQGIDCETFRPDVHPWPLEVERPIVLAVGLTPEKSPELALEAVALIGGSAVFAGEGPLSQRLDSLAAQRLGPRRYHRLSLPRSQMPRLYAAADLVVLASPRESAPLTVLEALACNKPIVAAADPARTEMIGDCGVLVGEQTPDSYADGIASALSREWDDRPRQRALHYSIDNSAQRLGDLLQELAESRS
jgi:glycosyltransferase involved in cell wall biosynthesis